MRTQYQSKIKRVSTLAITHPTQGVNSSSIQLQEQAATRPPKEKRASEAREGEIPDFPQKKVSREKDHSFSKPRYVR
jgi:hypothetical protein